MKVFLICHFEIKPDRSSVEHPFTSFDSIYYVFVCINRNWNSFSVCTYWNFDCKISDFTKFIYLLYEAIKVLGAFSEKPIILL